MAAKKADTPMHQKPLFRSRNDRMLTGLLGGLGEFLGVNPVLLRLGFAAVTAFTGFIPGIAAYFIGSIIVPEK